MKNTWNIKIQKKILHEIFKDFGASAYGLKRPCARQRSYDIIYNIGFCICQVM